MGRYVAECSVGRGDSRAARRRSEQWRAGGNDSVVGARMLAGDAVRHAHATLTQTLTLSLALYLTLGLSPHHVRTSSNPPPQDRSGLLRQRHF